MTMAYDGDTGNAENLHWVGQLGAITTYTGSAAGTNGCYTSVDLGYVATDKFDYVYTGLTASS